MRQSYKDKICPRCRRKDAENGLAGHIRCKSCRTVWVED